MATTQTETPCTVETCLAEPAIARPVPLCTRHGIETALAVLPLALAEALTDSHLAHADEPVNEPERVDPTELERAAISALRVTGTPIGRRTVERAIRSLGGRCRSERAVVLARWAREGADLSLFDTTDDRLDAARKRWNES